MSILSKLKGAATFALDLTAAVAKNPLAILSPTKEAKKIEKLRTSGTKEERLSYIRTTGVQTALNVGGVLAGGGLLGAGAKKAATTIGSKAIQLGVVAAPFVVGSSTIRETVASTSPVEIGVKSAEKLEKKIKGGDETALGVSSVVGLISAGAVGAGLVAATGLAVDYFKSDKVEENVFQPTGAPVKGSLTPMTPQTESINIAKEVTSSTKKRRKNKKRASPQMPSINIKIDNREDNDTNDRKVYKGRHY